MLAVHTVIGENILDVLLAVRTVVGANILDVITPFATLDNAVRIAEGGSKGGGPGGAGALPGTLSFAYVPPRINQPLFSPSSKTSPYFCRCHNETQKSWDVWPDSSKSGWSFFSCPHGGRGKYFGRFFSCSLGGRVKYFGRFF